MLFRVGKKYRHPKEKFKRIWSVNQLCTFQFIHVCDSFSIQFPIFPSLLSLFLKVVHYCIANVIVLKMY